MSATVYKFETSFWSPRSIDDIWNFFSNAKNLEAISPPIYGLKVLGNGVIGDDTLVEMTLNPLGLPLGLKWISKITDRNGTGSKRSFIDLQESGPFAYWKHSHIFVEGASSIKGERSGALIKAHQPGTWLIDKVEYSLPLEQATKFAQKIFVEKSLAHMFLHRKTKLQEQFGN